jgi:hypothetical protein
MQVQPQQPGNKIKLGTGKHDAEGPHGWWLIGIASAPKVDGSVLRTQFGNTKASRSNALVSI